MRVYLAARYSRMAELSGYAADLAADGIDVTSRWIDGRHETPPAGIAADSPEHLRWAAEEDIADLEAADVLVAFTEPEGNIAGRGRGGRHVELGYALAWGLDILIVGYRENIFCHLSGVGFARDWPEARVALAGLGASEARRG